mgnify:CR=1 FL=1
MPPLCGGLPQRPWCRCCCTCCCCHCAEQPPKVLPLLVQLWRAITVLPLLLLLNALQPLHPSRGRHYCNSHCAGSCCKQHSAATAAIIVRPAPQPSQVSLLLLPSRCGALLQPARVLRHHYRHSAAAPAAVTVQQPAAAETAGGQRWHSQGQSLQTLPQPTGSWQTMPSCAELQRPPCCHHHAAACHNLSQCCCCCAVIALPYCYRHCAAAAVASTVQQPAGNLAEPARCCCCCQPCCSSDCRRPNVAQPGLKLNTTAGALLAGVEVSVPSSGHSVRDLN